MMGILYVWGNDENGFWKKSYDCYQKEVGDILSQIGSFEDYDFEF